VVLPGREIAEQVWTTAGGNESPEFGVVILHGLVCIAGGMEKLAMRFALLQVRAGE